MSCKNFNGCCGGKSLLQETLKFHRSHNSLFYAINAVYFTCPGKLHPHQYRNAYTKTKVTSALRGRARMLSRQRDFERLFDLVYRIIHPIKGVGPLTVYDVALRLGTYLGVMPQKYVYLHAGALDGYKKFHPGAPVSFRVRMGPELRRYGLTAVELEDFLCRNK